MAEISQYSLKFRPRRWEDVYGQDNIVKYIKISEYKNVTFQ